MPEQESGYVPEKKYDPAVEKIMETSGPDIGRVKDKEVAFDAAVAEDSRRSERRPSQVQDGPESDEMNKLQTGTLFLFLNLNNSGK